MDFEEVLKGALLINAESVSAIKEERLVSLKKCIDIMCNFGGTPRVLFLKGMNRITLEVATNEVRFDSSNKKVLEELFKLADSFSISPNIKGEICIGISLKNAFEKV